MVPVLLTTTAWAKMAAKPLGARIEPALLTVRVPKPPSMPTPTVDETVPDSGMSTVLPPIKPPM